jgi:hypothetical protein
MRVLDILLKHLPTPYVDLIINNINDHTILDEEGTSITAELLVLFDWQQSTEGYDFWDQVMDYLQGDAELPQLPINIEYYTSSVIVMKDGLYVMNAGDTGLNIKYDILMHELKNSTRKVREQVLMWLN